MTAPLRTAGQFLAESGFAVAADSDAFPEYPELDAQLQALRKLDRTAPEIPWVEYALGKAREARLADDRAAEQQELGVARAAIERSFKRRTPQAQWPTLAIVLGIIGLVGFALWLERRRRARLARRRQHSLAAPFPEHDADAADDAEGEDDV